MVTRAAAYPDVELGEQPQKGPGEQHPVGLHPDGRRDSAAALGPQPVHRVAGAVDARGQRLAAVQDDVDVPHAVRRHPDSSRPPASRPAGRSSSHRALFPTLICS
ncbi:hypothetical protein [Nonomuraea rubra]|uniref:Uncharacterized protein n=1 Tax=Nonomuraea rubra TaxID=46180 RepID=A0A7X0NL10_9ACTN|nr:hypothetical protein [Nonomuraea rubra]MBB6545409.1 hypothetical protein [Nonomuraea rubra]